MKGNNVSRGSFLTICILLAYVIMSNSITTAQEVDLRLRLRSDFPFYAENCLKIKPKETAIVPLVLNDCQMYVHKQLEAQKKRKGYVRALIDKPRQVGVSTVIEGRFFRDATNIPGIEVMIITEADKSLNNIFEMVKRYQEYCPEPMRPKTKATNEKALIYEMGSRYDVMTCKAIGGKGVTKQRVHKSESAYYPDSTIPTIAGFMESVPSEYPGILGTEIIEETTANGVGGAFHAKWIHYTRKWEEYRESGEKGPEPEYICIFMPWYWHTPYSNPIDDNERQTIRETLSEHEKWLAKQKNLRGGAVTYEQLAWRRWKIEDMEPPQGFTKEEYFKQWYPSTAEESFLFSGNRVFPNGYVRAAERECYGPEHRGELEMSTGKFKRIQGGRLSIWDLPRTGKQYVIGADVAEGLVKGDYSCADVLEIPTGRQVAHWHGHIDPDDFGEVLYYLGKFYNYAIVGVEANNHGHTTISTLTRMRYSQLYMREQIDGTGKKMKRYGWLTTTKSKHTIIDRLNATLREGDSGIVYAKTIEELDSYSLLVAAEQDGDRSRMGAKPGHFDDRVMSYAIAVEMMLGNPHTRHEREKKRYPKRGG